MSDRLTGKTAFVTGAAQGIGRAITEAYLREGAQVVASDINSATLQALADSHTGDGLQTIQLDVTDAVEVKHCAARFDTVNVLVNCSGVVKNGTVMDCSDADWEASMAVNTTAMFHTIAAFLPGMLAQQRGSIINIASIVSSLRGAVNRFAYGASKGAVLGITKSVAIDYIGQGIRCNAICPGTIDSPSLQQRLKDTGDYDQARETFTNRQPMGRLGTVEEVAAIAITLASEEAGFMTGTEILIDGGWGL
ncbi:MAG: 2-keto-3-deoxy-L-fuconate dehydrogenase [Halioglobus sp.]|jgi:2-keto-3-deoxy-L-fuconate dehydrogenase